MTSNIVKNRIVVELARECLQSSGNGFANVGINKERGTFPDVYATGFDTINRIDYLIGITGRAETKDDGDWAPRFNLVRTAEDRERAKSLAAVINKNLAFVAIALRKSDNSYAAYFGEIDAIRFPRSIPMLPADRSKYRQLSPYTQDKRVADFFS